MEKSPLETYGKKTVFTAQRRRQRSARIRRLLLVLLILIILVLAGWFGYKQLTKRSAPAQKTTTQQTKK